MGVNDVRENMKQSAGTSSDGQRYLAFSLNEEEYAIPLLHVKEVIALPEVTQIPYTPSHFLGIMNLRGQVISIVDLRLKFKMKKADKTSETTVVICDFDSAVLGVVVDSVNCVMALKEGDIAPKPEIESSVNSGYITGVTKRDKKLVVLLNLAKALSVEDRQAMNKATSATGATGGAKGTPNSAAA
jgi:purine-binding chemotaxis protein CheW